MTSLKSMFDASLREALGIVIFAGIIYWLIDGMLLASPMISLRGINVVFTAASSEAIVLFTSAAVLLAILLGAFDTSQGRA
jgi:uncharacterized membrane protein YjgN (DUF898 family)